MKPKIEGVVIGAGLAGIAVALRLKAQGMHVLVLEKNESYGGKLNVLSFEGYRWDKGPSLFTLPNQVDELFELFGKKPTDLFEYERIEEPCRYYFADGSDFLFVANPEIRNRALIEHFNEKEGQAAIDYIAESKSTYEEIGDFFVDNPKYKLKNVMDLELVKRYPKLVSRKLMRSLNSYNSSKFSNPNLVQLFNRYATYNGSDPFQMSGLYSMIPHLEMNDGTYFPKKGMRSIVDSLYDLAVEQGVEFQFNVTDISAKKVNDHFEITTHKQTLEAINLISAIDCVPFYKNILKDKKLAAKYERQERSTSALIFYWAVETIIPEFKLHNVFFGADYLKEFKTIFKHLGLVEDPTVYIHLSSVVNPSDAPENGQNWFVMINVPAGMVIGDAQRKAIRDYIIELVFSRVKVNIEPFLKYENYWDPIRIGADTGGFEGSLYGAASNGKMAAITRHGNDSSKYKNLYFCGGTVHPGGGIPLVLKSSKIVATLINQK